jgi:hypothetical protein
MAYYRRFFASNTSQKTPRLLFLIKAYQAGVVVGIGVLGGKTNTSPNAQLSPGLSALSLTNWLAHKNTMRSTV